MQVAVQEENLATNFSQEAPLTPKSERSPTQEGSFGSFLTMLTIDSLPSLTRWALLSPFPTTPIAALLPSPTKEASFGNMAMTTTAKSSLQSTQILETLKSPSVGIIS
ncbi:MAG: hypothetical protein HZLCBSQH_002409, partial [Candidatus Fervidibacterota bacterium]